MYRTKSGVIHKVPFFPNYLATDPRREQTAPPELTLARTLSQRKCRPLTRFPAGSFFAALTNFMDLGVSEPRWPKTLHGIVLRCVE